MNETLWAYCQSSLQNHLYENAIFLAERLCAETPSEASRLLLANCHYASGAPARACAILGNCSAPQNRYLLALCHVKLGRHLEAQRALLGSASPSADPAGTAIVPNGAAGLYLLGTICLKVQPQPPASLPRDDTNERSRAVLYFKRALEIDPYLWSAYEALAALGKEFPPPPLPLPAAPPGWEPPLAMAGCGAAGSTPLPGGGTTPVRQPECATMPGRLFSPPDVFSAPPPSMGPPLSTAPLPL
mmetsp:Transcript_48619/g.157586  ORF Transcript_48619/g.157586 Transcript_48619/m.157586 type:complete len:244 (+) Transcript_48619:28-759(+)